MKFKVATLLLFLVILCSVQGKTQNIPSITAAIQQNDTKKLALHFGDNVDLKLPNTDGVFSKQQTILIVKSFFDEAPVSNYELKHQGNSKNDALYLIGSLTRNEQLYRTYILLKKINGNHQILEFNVEIDE